MDDVNEQARLVQKMWASASPEQSESSWGYVCAAAYAARCKTMPHSDHILYLPRPEREMKDAIAMFQEATDQGHEQAAEILGQVSQLTEPRPRI